MFHLLYGVDIGTSTLFISKVKLGQGGKVEVRPLQLSNKSFQPTVVYVNPNDSSDLQFGEEALNNSKSDSKNLIYSCKRFVGKKFTGKGMEEEKEKEFEDLMRNLNLSYDLELNDSKEPVVIVVEGYQPKRISINNIFEFIMKKVASYIAEDTRKEYITNKKNIKKIVIDVCLTHPASFHEERKVVYLKFKGLLRECFDTYSDLKHVVSVDRTELLAEPISAVCYFTYHREKYQDLVDKEYYFVYDLGGGTFDCCIVRHTHNRVNIYEIKHTEGIEFLGGDNIDSEICKKLKELIGSQTNENGDIAATKQQNERVLIDISRKAKEYFSEKLYKDKISEDHYSDDSDDENSDSRQVNQDYYKDESTGIEVCKSYFEEAIKSTIEETFKNVDDAMDKFKNELGKKSYRDLNMCILLVGGGSLIPAIKEEFKKKYKDLEIIDSRDQQMCVSCGAALSLTNSTNFSKTLLKSGVEVIEKLTSSIFFVDSRGNLKVLARKGEKLSDVLKYEPIEFKTTDDEPKLFIYESGEDLSNDKNFEDIKKRECSIYVEISLKQGVYRLEFRRQENRPSKIKFEAVPVEI